jgi:predicted membrane protein
MRVAGAPFAPLKPPFTGDAETGCPALRILRLLLGERISIMNMTVEQLQPRAPMAGVSGFKLIVGIFFALLGLILTLDNLDLIDGDRFLAYWPLALIAIGILKFQDPAHRVLGAFVIGIGALNLIANTVELSISIFDLWPVVLILAGIGIVAHAFGFRLPSLSGEPASTIWAVFGVRKIVIDSPNYTGGRIIAFMGACELDLTKAGIEQGSASIELLAMWGHIEIKVPDGWEVIGNTTPIMGGAEILTRATPGGRRLNVNGLALMGGVEIKSVPAEAI